MTLDGVSMTFTEQDQSFPYIRGQVARILLEHAGDGNNQPNRLAQRDIATMLGTGWDKVHLSLKSLYHEGVIRIERNRIIINKELIQKAAGLASSPKD
jgi:DNA-binding GntR family transcriptional regulator